MTQQSGDAADRLLKLMIDGVEVTIKLAGSGTKNLATALYAHFNGKKQLKGATNLNKLLSSGKELRIFRLAESDLSVFKTQAKKYGVLFSAIKDTRSDKGYVDLFIKAEDIVKVNHVLGRMDYDKLTHEAKPEVDKDSPAKETEEVKKDNPQRKNSNTQKSNFKHEEKVNVEQVVRDIKNSKKETMTPDNWKAYLAINSYMHNYSIHNKERIFEQSPSASVVMSKTKWRALGRYPKQGAKGINITVPEYENGQRTGNYVDANVYDISETYGKDLSQSSYSIKLEDGTTEMKSEIDRLKASAPVTVEIKSNLETDSFYNAGDKKIYIRDDITDSEVYKGLLRETQYANAHTKQGNNYSRADNRLIAESVAFSMANKYGVDTKDFRFDCIPDAINGLDGKDVSELINPATAMSNNEIKKAEKNLDKFKAKDKPSVRKDLKANKDAIRKGIYKTDNKIKAPVMPKGKDR